MNRSRIRLLLIISLSIVALAWLFSSQRPTQIAKAAPQASSSVYLPFIVRAGTSTELVSDGGFEAGLPNSYWKTTSSKDSSILDKTAPTHGGSWKAWLGGSTNDLETLWQVISVPTNATSLQVSFWYQVSTTESPVGMNDSLEIQIRNASGTTLQTPYTLYDLDASTTWYQKTLSISPTYAGQTIQVAFIAQTDSSNETSFFIDDVSAQACY